MTANSHKLFKSKHPDETYRKLNKPVIIADHIRTPENMGAILRLAGNIGARNTLFISDVATNFKKYKINRTASGAAAKVHWKIIGSGELRKNLPEGYSLVALETSSDADDLFQFQFPEKTAFIIGNEVKGISDDLMQMADHIVYIPIPGPISSLNVSHALSVALFAWLKQKT